MVSVRWWLNSEIIVNFEWQIPRKGGVPQTDKVRCYEPATMKYLGHFPALTPDEVCVNNVAVFISQEDIRLFTSLIVNFALRHLNATSSPIKLFFERFFICCFNIFEVHYLIV